MASRSSRASTAAPTHETVARSIIALENLEHRGAEGADPNTGDGAGHPDADPRRVLPRGRGEDLPPAGRLRRRRAASCPQDEERRAELEALITETVEAGGPARRRVARRPDRQGLLRHHGLLPPAATSSTWSSRPRATCARPGRLRAQALRDPPGGRARRRARSLVVPSLSSRTIVYKGMLTPMQLEATTPTCRTRASRRRWRWSTRASPPTRSPPGSSRTRTGARPQRRDQHAARQRQLDARAGVPASQSTLFGDDLQKIAADRAPGRVGLRDARQRARAAGARRPQLPARDDDADPGGFEGRDDMPRA